MANILESISNTSDKALDIGEKYIKDTQEYYKLKIFQQLTISISLVTKALVIGGLLFIGLMFLALALASAIGTWIDNTALGYLIVGVLVLCIASIIFFNRGFINKKIISILSNKFFNS